MTTAELGEERTQQAAVKGGAERLSPRAVERRARILSTASRLLGEHGYDGVSMRTIAAQSGVVEKTLYNIYGTKDRLIAAAARERVSFILAAAGEAAPNDGWGMLRAYLSLAVRLMLDDPRVAKAMARIHLEHSELVGMEEVFQVWAGGALNLMEQAEMLEASCPRQSIIRLIRLSVTTAGLLWSKGELTDEELESYGVTRVVETLLPSVRPDRQGEMMAELRTARAVLARRYEDRSTTT